MTLFDSSNNVVATATTDSTGYYAFNNLTPGNYSVSETTVPSGLELAAVNPLTTINPATVSGNSINVTVEDLSTLPSLQVNFTASATPVSGADFALLASPYNAKGTNVFTTGGAAGAFDLTLQGAAGNLERGRNRILLHRSNPGHPISPSHGHLTPARPVSRPGRPPTPAWRPITERLGYLYNTYGRFINKLPTPNNNNFGDSVNAAGFALAVWALEYNNNPVTSLSSPDTPFEVNQAAGTTSTNILSSANAYLADALGKSADFYFLNATAGGTRGLQGMMSTDLLNFTNSGTNTSTVSTSIQDSSSGSVTGDLGERVFDTATVTGTAGVPTGTVTYNFYTTSTPTYGVTTPFTTQTLRSAAALSPTPLTTAAFGAGSYSYIASTAAITTTWAKSAPSSHSRSNRARRA